MSAPLWVLESAAAFWRSAGEEQSFPRDLRRPVARGLPLTIVPLPRLRVAAIDEWLYRQGAACSLHLPDRPVRACLFARFGHGAIFLDAADPEDQQRFSLAHEVAHFLRDYQQPRSLAVERLGPQALEVLDGARPAHQTERIHALLSKAPLGVFIHLMARDSHGHIDNAAVSAAEHDADLLAWELLAPAEQVLARLRPTPRDERRRVARRILSTTYGLPPEIAARYAASLLPAAPGNSLARRLGLVR